MQVVAQGETPDADQLNDGLVSLNDLLSAWGNERLMVYQTVQETITLVGGQSAYDIGVGATSLNTSMPIRIERAFIRLNGIDDPLEILTRDQYQSIASKSDSSDIPPVCITTQAIQNPLSGFLTRPLVERSISTRGSPHGVFYALHGRLPSQWL